MLGTEDHVRCKESGRVILADRFFEEAVPESGTASSTFAKRETDIRFMRKKD